MTTQKNERESIIRSENSQAVVSSIGGTIKSLTLGNEKILFPAHITTDGKARGGMPICAPWFGSAPQFGERKHGHLRELEVYAMERKEESITLHFHRSADEQYPWELHYSVNYTIIDRLLMCSLTIKRLDDGNDQPVSVGPAFHPYFNTAGEKVFLSFDGELEKEVNFQNKAEVIPLNGRNFTIRTGNKKIALRLGGDFGELFSERRLALWSDAPQKYSCVEPIFQDNKLFNTPGGRKLVAGESVTVSMVIALG